jgi:hypothetical protein
MEESERDLLRRVALIKLFTGRITTSPDLVYKKGARSEKSGEERREKR